MNGNHRTDVNYELYYINIARNTVTAGVPLIVLVALNLLVYKHLVRRRAFIAKHRGRTHNRSSSTDYSQLSSKSTVVNKSTATPKFVFQAIVLLK